MYYESLLYRWHSMPELPAEHPYKVVCRGVSRSLGSDEGLAQEGEMIIEMTAKDIEEQPEMSSDEIIKGEVECSQWQERDDIWWASR
jgi:hypothetical protein